MARYGKIDVRMWGDAKYLALSAPPPNAQTLWVYLLTGAHRTSLPGLFMAGEAMLAEALRWPLAAFRKCFNELVEQGMVQADTRARVVWIPKAIAYNPPESPNVVRSWRAHWDEVPECQLKTIALQAFASFFKGKSEAFQKAFREAIGEGIPSPFGESVAVTVAVAVTGAGALPEAHSSEASDPLSEFDPEDPLKAKQKLREAFETAWNDAGLRSFGRLNHHLQALLEGRMLDPEWRKIWRQSLVRAGKCPVLATGEGGQRGPLDPRQFLKDSDFAHSILRGVFDPRGRTIANGKPPPVVVADPFAALEEKHRREAQGS